MASEIQSPGKYFRAIKRGKPLSVWFDIHDGLKETVCAFNSASKEVVFQDNFYSMSLQMLGDLYELLKLIGDVN